MRNLFTKSIVVRRNLNAGTIITEDMLALKKPGTGLPAEKLALLIGRRLRNDLSKDIQIRESDLE